MLRFSSVLLAIGAASALSATGALERRVLQLAAQSSNGIQAAIDDLIAAGGIPSPALSRQIEGEWKLVHISSSSFDARNPLGRRSDGTQPGLEGVIAGFTGGESAMEASSSPIQRWVTSAFSVTQTISGLGTADGRVEQLVQTPFGELHLNAAATVDASVPERVSFAFDEGYFETNPGKVRIPYPVPFRLLGKEANGYLDTTYLGDAVRVSIGNKGTTFTLERV
jgi:hypothetical protein